MTQQPSTKMPYHNLALLVKLHPRRHGCKAAPRKQEHNNLPQTSKLEGGQAWTLEPFPLRDSKIPINEWSVDRYTDYYGLYLPGRELQSAINIFYKITTTILIVDLWNNAHKVQTFHNKYLIYLTLTNTSRNKCPWFQVNTITNPVVESGVTA